MNVVVYVKGCYGDFMHLRAAIKQSQTKPIPAVLTVKSAKFGEKENF